MWSGAETPFRSRSRDEPTQGDAPVEQDPYFSEGLTTHEVFESASEQNRRLLRQEELLLDWSEQVLEVMDREGVSRAELGRRLGMSERRVSQMLDGRREPTLRTVADVADALGHEVRFVME